MEDAERLARDILYGIGGESSEKFPPVSGRIGDPLFNFILHEVRYRHNHPEEVEQKNKEFALEDISRCTDAAQIKRDTEIHRDFYEYLKRLQGIDYSPGMVGEQFRKVRGLDNHEKLAEVPFQLADSHRHTYLPLAQRLRESETPLTIVRLDHHSDRRKELEAEVTKANYLSQIVLDKKLAPKIERVIDIVGDSVGMQNDFVNNVPFLTTGILNVPEITGPVVLDIDLDGLENGGHRREFFRDMPGGHIYRHSTYYNQTNVVVHPRVAVRILKSKIHAPQAVYIALERSFRNRLFWCRIEKDFFEELVA